MAITKIMLVEDDPDDRELFSEAISQVGVPVTLCYANDGIDALKQLTTGECMNVQLILLDVNMPRMNGWETLTLLKKDLRLREIPVIMFSTCSAQKDVDTALELGAVAFITKPADFPHIVHLVDVIVALPKDRVERVVKDYFAG